MSRKKSGEKHSRTLWKETTLLKMSYKSIQNKLVYSKDFKEGKCTIDTL
jgi:hypothetical protein